jgi:hypothetical protein
VVPELRQGDIVVMDNLSSHKGPKVRKMVEAAGANLPSCSPAFARLEEIEAFPRDPERAPSSGRIR